MELHALDAIHIAERSCSDLTGCYCCGDVVVIGDLVAACEDVCAFDGAFCRAALASEAVAECRESVAEIVCFLDWDYCSHSSAALVCLAGEMAAGKAVVGDSGRCFEKSAAEELVEILVLKTSFLGRSRVYEVVEEWKLPNCLKALPRRY